MSLSKIFNIQVSYGRTPPHQRHLIDTAIEMEIVTLAKKEGVTLAFHKVVDEELLGGGRPMLIEMPDSFAEKVKSIPGVTYVEENKLYKTKPRI